MDSKDINEYKIEEEITDKKSNTFNLIIGLATLIIAILGASFAYFTMSSGSEENDILVKSAFVSIDYGGNTIVEAQDLIPTSEDVMLWAYQERVKETYPSADGVERTYQCIDSRNKKVCYVYEFKVQSEGEGETTKIKGTIRVNQNQFLEDVIDPETGGPTGEKQSGLSYMVFKITRDSEGNVTNYEKVSAEEASSRNPADAGKPGFVRFGIPIQPEEEGGEITPVENVLFGTDGYIDIQNSKENQDVWTTFQLVIWLHDDTDEQNQEQGKSFAGTIDVNVNSGDNVDKIITGQKGDENQEETSGTETTGTETSGTETDGGDTPTE